MNLTDGISAGIGRMQNGCTFWPILRARAANCTTSEWLNDAPAENRDIVCA